MICYWIFQPHSSLCCHLTDFYLSNKLCMMFMYVCVACEPTHTHTYMTIHLSTSGIQTLQDYASVKLSTAEQQHHNTHKNKVYMPPHSLHFIRITQHNTNFHKTKSMVFCRRTDVSRLKRKFVCTRIR